MPLTNPEVARISASNSTFSGTVRITGGANITVGTDASGVSISGAGGGAFAGGMSNLGNTSGTTGTVQSQMLVVGGPNVTVSQSINGQSATLSLSAPAPSAAAVELGMSNIGNTSGTTGTVNSRLLVVGGPNITASQSIDGQNATVSLSAAAAAAAEVNWVEFGQVVNNGTFGNASLFLQPVTIAHVLTATEADIALNVSGASNSTAGASWGIGVYTRQTGASSTRLSLATSASSTSAWTSNSVASNDWLGIYGHRIWSINNHTFSFTPGEYFVGIFHRSTNAGTYSLWGNSAVVSWSGQIGSVSNTLNRRKPFFGVLATSTVGLPNSILSSDVGESNGFRVLPWVQFVNLAR